GLGATVPVIQLQAAGLSMVEAHVQVVNSFGVVIADGSASSPTNNDVTVNLPTYLPVGTYYVRVSSATSDVFGIGSYRVPICGSSSGWGDLQQVSGVHSTLAAAATLNRIGDQIAYAARVNVTDLSGVTVLQLQAPPATSSNPVNLFVSVSSVDAP